MARTERDIMRHKRYQILQKVAAEFGIEPSASGGFRITNELDIAYEKALAMRRVYRHECSPYCLHPQDKRVDRRRFRARVKDTLRHGRFDEAVAMKPRRH